MAEFSLPPERMREIGYRVIDAIVEHWSTLGDKPAMRVASRPELEARLREAMPSQGTPFEDVLQKALEDVFTAVAHINHPRFFGFIPTPSNFVSAMADAITAGFNPFCGTWLEGSAAAQVELVTIDWLREALGMPEGAGGLFTSGGSMANLTALTAARACRPEHPDKHVFYCSDQTHSSVERAVKVLGYRGDQFRRLTSDEAFRLDLSAVRAAVAADRAAGLLPHAVIANAGGTNTGAVDPLPELVRFCRAENLWLHVDGAYGAAAVLCGRGRALLEAIGDADSVTLDPHKWLFQPYPSGCVMVRDPKILRRFFQVSPEYLQDAETQRGEVNYSDYGIELTRPFRAFKLWFSLKVFGAEAFARAIEHGMAMAERVEEKLRSCTEWEIVSPACMAIVCFRHRAPQLGPDGEDELQRNIARLAAEDGTCFVSTTVLRGRSVLRMCTIQHATTEADCDRTMAFLTRCAREG